MDAPSTYIVHSFVRPAQDVDPDAIADIAHKRWKAEVWESADFENLRRFFQGHASDAVAKTWYSALSDEENLHWKYYYSSRFNHRHDGDIPDEVTNLLEEAVEFDCFQSFKIRRHEQQFVLLGFLRETGACAPVAAWYPEESSLPNPDQLREHYEAVKAEEATFEAAAAKTEREHAAHVQQRLNQLRVIARVHWGVASAALGTILALFFLTIGWWACIPTVLILYIAGCIHGGCHISNTIDLRQTLTRPLLILSLAATVGFGGTWLQFGTTTESLTLCSSASFGSKYEAPNGDPYKLSTDAYNQLLDSTPQDTSSSAVKVKAEVRQNTFVGEPEIVSVRVVGDGYEACFTE